MHSGLEQGNWTIIIRLIASNRSIEIDDPRNPGALSVRIEGSFDDPSDQSTRRSSATIAGLPNFFMLHYGLSVNGKLTSALVAHRAVAAKACRTN
jgi:hypothetical protein